MPLGSVFRYFFLAMMYSSSSIQELVRLLSLRLARTARQSLAGLYASSFQGRGLEFAELSEYQPGSDARSIDWRATLRSGRTYSRRYQEDRELPLLLACDCSASLFHQPQAWPLLCEAAGLFAYCAAWTQDPLGLLCFSDRLEQRLAPARGLRQAGRVIAGLQELQPLGRRTDLAHVFAWLQNVQRRPARIIVFSDLYATGYQPALQRLASRHEVIVAHIKVEPLASLPEGFWLAVQDAESSQRSLCHTGSAGRATACQAEDCCTAIRSCGAQYFTLTPVQTVLEAVRQFLQERLS